MPLSTLMPEITPCSSRSLTKGLPFLVFWRMVSSNMMQPEMYSPRSGVRKSSSRYERRFSSSLATPIGAKRLPMVPLDSSAARMPLPPHAMALAVAASSSRYLAPGPAVAKSSASKEKPKEQAEDLAFLAFLAPAEEARFFFGILGLGVCWGVAVTGLGTAEVEQLRRQRQDRKQRKAEDGWVA